MIYLLGGTARTGKSLLARRLNRRHDLPVISTDLLRGVLVRVDSELRAAMQAGDVEREADVFYPHLRQAVACARIQLRDALFEGVGFLPQHVDQLPRDLQTEVRSCFLGRSSATAEDLFSHESEHQFYNRLDAAAQAAMVRGIVEWSARLQAACERLGFPFVDLAGAGFEESLQEAEGALLGAQPGAHHR